MEILIQPQPPLVINHTCRMRQALHQLRPPQTEPPLTQNRVTDVVKRSRFQRENASTAPTAKKKRARLTAHRSQAHCFYRQPAAEERRREPATEPALAATRPQKA